MLARRRRQSPLDALTRQREIGVAGEVAGIDFRRVHEHAGLVFLDRRQHLLGARDDEIAAEHEIGLARGDADRMHVLRRIADLHVAIDRAALLREAGHVDHADAFAGEMRRHAEDRGNRHDAGAADPGHEDRVRRFADLGQARLLQRRPAVARFHFPRRGLARLRAMHGHEGWAEPVDAGKILVARGLVDDALAAELRLERLHRHAVRLHAAVAAAFADEFVDDDALVWIGERAALPATALLGRAGLVVEQHGHAVDCGQLALHLVEFFTGPHRQTGWPREGWRIFLRLVGDDDDLSRALGRDLARDHVDGQPAFMALAAGHRDGVVEQDLVGDVGVGIAGPAQGQRTGVVVGAVAEILEDVLALRERRLADPVRALAAHLGVALGRAIHPLRHEMAADAGIGPHALRHSRRRVVRAAGAEIGGARRRVLRVGQHRLRLMQALHLMLQRVVARVAQDALADANGDLVGVERALHGEEPSALLVLLADDDRLVRRAEQFLADLHLDQRALLLDNDDHLEAAREFLQAFGLERPRAADLVEPHAEIVGAHLVDAEVVHRLAYVEIGFAGRDDADLRVRPARRDDPVEFVGADEGEHRVALVFLQPGFLLEDAVARADREATGRHLVVGRHHDLHAIEGAIHRRRRFDCVLEAFEPDPHARIARHREGIEAVVEDLLHAGGRHDRHHHVDEVEIGLMRGGRRFRRVVVAHHHDGAAERRGAGEIGVAEDVAGAVDARALAVPDAEDAVVFAVAAQLGLLRAPDGGRGEILVQARLEDDVVLVENFLGRMHLRIDGAEGRAAIAGDEARRVVAGAAVALLLHQQQPDDRLRAGREDLLLRQVELVVEGNALERIGECRCLRLYADCGIFNRTVDRISHGVTSWLAHVTGWSHSSVSEDMSAILT